MVDIWEDEHAIPTISDSNREWRVRYDRLFQQGFRDGIDEGMQVKMQDGFDEGFQVGMSVGNRYGFVGGALKLTAAVSPENAARAQDAITTLRSKGQAEAKELCMKDPVHTTESVPPKTPTNTFENTPLSAESHMTPWDLQEAQGKTDYYLPCNFLQTASS